MSIIIPHALAIIGAYSVATTIMTIICMGMFLSQMRREFVNIVMTKGREEAAEEMTVAAKEALAGYKFVIILSGFTGVFAYVIFFILR